MNSRLAGDTLEFTIALFLTNNKIKWHDEYTKNKFNKWKNNIDDKLSNEINIILNNIFNNYFKLLTFKSYKLMSDNHGTKGNNTDIIIYQNNNYINISCKTNNISIKHQRPSGFPKQAKLCIHKSEQYIIDYKKCNDKWYIKFKNLITFDNIIENDKMLMYQDFNNITCNYLYKCNEQEIINFYNFLISYDRSYIFNLNRKKRNIIIYDYSNVKMPTQISMITQYKQYIEILFDNKISLKMRLHNASKTITKKISVKYDTKLVNMNDLYTQTNFTY